MARLGNFEHTAGTGRASTIRRMMATAALALALTGPGLAPVAAQVADREVVVVAQPLADAILALSRQTDTTIFVNGALVAGISAPAVRGRMTVEAALDRLLAGTGLGYQRNDDGVYAITRVPAGPAAGDDQPDTEPDMEIEEVLVTGTSIPGFAPESSPLKIFDREEILRSGVTTTEQFIRTLPQNFGGGASEFLPNGTPNDRASQANSTGGTGINLRGLGVGTTLTLLNGARMAPNSEQGAFVDVSLIPISALERVEVLTDGASSIYGGDAVGGVVNFVTRRDFEGAETSLRYGTVTEGSLDEYRLSQSLGTAWNSGNVLAVYEYLDRDSLSLADRPDIRPPVQADGTPLPFPEAFFLQPRQERHSALVSGAQEIGDRAELFATMLFSNRQGLTSTVVTLLGGSVANTAFSAQTWMVNAGGRIDLWRDWSLAVNGTYNQVDDSSSQVFFFGAIEQPGADLAIDSELWSIDAILSGSLFTTPAGPVQVALGGHFRQEDFLNFVGILNSPLSQLGRDVAAVFAEAQIPIFGPGNERPGLRRLEVNLSARMDDFSDFGTSTNPKVGLLWSPFEGVNVRGSYSEAFRPPALGLVGAFRGGSIVSTATLNEQFGGEAPDPSIADVGMLSVFGQAPDLGPETSRNITAGIDMEATWGTQSLTANLTYYDIRFEGRLNRTPVPEGINPNLAHNAAFVMPELFPPGTFIFNPSQDQIQAVVDTLNGPNPLFDPNGIGVDNVGIINSISQTRNLALTESRGLDIDLAYSLETSFGTVSAGLGVAYQFDFIRQAAETTPPVQVLNTLFNPVDLRLRGNLGFTSGGFTGSVFVSYTDDYRSDNSAQAARIASYTTVDLNLSYTFGKGRGSPWLDGLQFTASVLNLFDQGPPDIPITSGTVSGAVFTPGFDPTNASPLNRFIAFAVRKTF